MSKDPVKKSPAPTKAKTAKKPSALQYYYANGKRKTSVASVRLHHSGTGKLTVNNRDGKHFFPDEIQQQIIFSPLALTSNAHHFDISVRVHGGGRMSQSEAVRHGIAKALLEYDPSLRLALKRAGFITRDSRIKERKKYGLHRARRAPQFSKR